MTTTLEETLLHQEVTDTYERKVDRFIDPATLKTLSRIKPWRSLLQIGFEWTAIATAIYLCSHHWNPFLYLLTIMWIGARQNALAALMHDATHYRLVHNKKLNDWIGEVFTAWPILVTLYGYRHSHWAHHRHVNQPEDPDWQRKQHDLFVYPKSGWDMLWISMKYLSGVYAVRELTMIGRAVPLPPALKKARLAFYLSVLTASIVFHFWAGLLVYWVVPLFTYFWWIIYVRGVAEHFGGIEHHEDLLQHTRHIEANWLERLFIAPNQVHAHIGHHLYPSVPFYNLDKLQTLLMQNPNYASRAHVTHGYLGFLRELLQSSPARDGHQHI